MYSSYIIMHGTHCCALQGHTYYVYLYFNVDCVFGFMYVFNLLYYFCASNASAACRLMQCRMGIILIYRSLTGRYLYEQGFLK